MNTPSNTPTVQWVDMIPEGRRGSPRGTSMWEPVVTQLTENPGKAALVLVADSTKKAESARWSIVSHARTRGVKLSAFVRGSNLYALVKED